MNAGLGRRGADLQCNTAAAYRMGVLELEMAFHGCIYLSLAVTSPPTKGRTLGEPVPSAPGQFLRGDSAGSHLQATFLTAGERTACLWEESGQCTSDPPPQPGGKAGGA